MVSHMKSVKATGPMLMQRPMCDIAEKTASKECDEDG